MSKKRFPSNQKSLVINVFEKYVRGDVPKRTISKMSQTKLYILYDVKIDEKPNEVVKVNQNAIFPMSNWIWKSVIERTISVSNIRSKWNVSKLHQNCAVYRNKYSFGVLRLRQNALNPKICTKQIIFHAFNMAND